MGVVALPDGESNLVGSSVPNFLWSKNGKHVAFLWCFLKNFSLVSLMFTKEEAAEKTHPGVFGYGLIPESSILVFRANCIRALGPATSRCCRCLGRAG